MCVSHNRDHTFMNSTHTLPFMEICIYANYKYPHPYLGCSTCMHTCIMQSCMIIMTPLQSHSSALTSLPLSISLLSLTPSPSLSPLSPLPPSPPPLPSDKFHVTVSPTSHSDNLQLKGQYILKISETEIHLFSASGAIASKFWSPLGGIRSASHYVIPISETRPQHHGMGGGAWGGGHRHTTTQRLLVITTAM